MSTTILGVSLASTLALVLIYAYIRHIQSQLKKHIFRSDEYKDYFKKL